MTPIVPAEFSARLARYPPDDLSVDAPWAVSGAEWLRVLPRLLDELVDEWGLRVGGTVRTGACAVAVPVHRDGEPAVLKVGWPHLEATTEHLGLRRWDGRGAVRLLRADPNRFALLLERLDATCDLMTLPAADACAVIGDLLAQLSAPALPQTRRLSAYLERKVSSFTRAPAVVPRRFLDQARQLAGELGRDPAVDEHVLHSDLHYRNVLRGQRQPWLAIDPKPLAGSRGFEVAPALWNRANELGTGSSVRRNLRRRLAIVCEHAGIDEDRARAWTIVREVSTALDAARVGGEGPARISLAVAIVKAMND